MGQTKHSVDLLIVDFRDLVSRHVLDVIVVSYHRIGIDSRHVSLFESFGEYSGVFFIEKKENSIKAAFLLSIFPIALVSLALEVLLDSAASPVAKAVLVLPEALSSYALGHGVDVLGTLEPVGGSLGIKLLIIVCLKREPTSFGFLGVSELHALFKYNKFELIRTRKIAQL